METRSIHTVHKALEVYGTVKQATGPLEDHSQEKQTADSAEISDDAQDSLDRALKAEADDTAQGSANELTTQELHIINDLKLRDRNVRQHEQAHKAVAGSYAIGGPFYQYQTGPDGKRYAVGGHVSIDTGKEADPEATIRKMDTVRRAALAPSDPSPQDRSVAAQATRSKQEALMELRFEQKEPTHGKALAHYAQALVNEAPDADQEGSTKSQAFDARA